MSVLDRLSEEAVAFVACTAQYTAAAANFSASHKKTPIANSAMSWASQLAPVSIGDSLLN